jgi:hypothetical protein
MIRIGLEQEETDQPEAALPVDETSILQLAGVRATIKFPYLVIDELSTAFPPELHSGLLLAPPTH